ncbi:MAG: fibronectin type III domain-containing protein [Bacillota bacterium]
MKKVRVCLTIVLLVASLLLPPSGLEPKVYGQSPGSGVNGEFAVSIYTPEGWQEAGSLVFGHSITEESLDLSRYINGSAAPVQIRLAQKSGGAAHLDRVFLGGVLPSVIRGGSPDIQKKLQLNDYDVTPMAPEGLELTFNSMGSGSVLRVAARIEGERISQVPFQFPYENAYRTITKDSSFYSYKLDSQRTSIRVDGSIEEVAQIAPFMKEYVVTGSGHPSGYIYAWVTNDDHNLYVIFDTTPDNTMDGDKDYAKVYVKTREGVKEFKVSVPEQRWGQPSFTYTNRVSYQHKIYEFAIPLSELGGSNPLDENTVHLAFAAYGTMAAFPGNFQPSIAYDSSGERFLAVYEKRDINWNKWIYGQFVTKDGVLTGTELNISGAYDYSSNAAVAYGYDGWNSHYLVVWEYRENFWDNPVIVGRIASPDGTLNNIIFQITEGDFKGFSPAVAYDSVNKRFMVVWRDSRNGIGDIYGQLIDLNGNLVGGNFPVCTQGSEQYKPQIAYDSANRRFLVVWEDERTAMKNIYGQILYQNGNNFGPAKDTNMAISVGENQRSSPSLTYDGVNGQFLVVWEDRRNSNVSGFNIYGQRIDANTGSLLQDNFLISNGMDSQEWPKTAFNPIAKKFLVVWQDRRNDKIHVYGQQVNSDGTLAGPGDANTNFEVKVDADMLHYPMPLFNPARQNFLVAVESETQSYDVQAQISYVIVGTQLQQNPPAADTGGPYVINYGDSLQLDGSQSSDPDGDILTAYNWDMNDDGNYFDFDGPNRNVGWSTLLNEVGVKIADPVTGLPKNTIRLRVTDATGLISIDETTLTVLGDLAPGGDNEAPTWPGGSTLTASDLTQTSLTLTWSNAQDNVGVAGYRVYKDDVLLDTLGNVNTYNVTGLSQGTGYTFRVEAGDAAGNWSGTGPTADATTAAGTRRRTTGTISGRLTERGDSGGEGGVFGAYVCLFPLSGFGDPIETITDYYGDYSFSDLAPGEYMIEFAPEKSSPGNYLPEWYDNQRSWRSAQIVLLGEGDDKVANAVLDSSVVTSSPQNSYYAQIKGRVKGSYGEYLAGISVYAYPQPIDFNTAPLGTITESDGSYAITNITPGNYVLEFAPETHGKYLPEWHGNKRSWREAEVITLLPSGLLNIDAAMELTPTPVNDSITGTVKGKLTNASGLPLQGLSVFAFLLSDHLYSIPTGAESKVDGSFEISGLAPGGYKLEFAPEESSSGRAKSEWFNNARSWREAEHVLVLPGRSITINVVMD